MACSGAYASAQDFAYMFCLDWPMEAEAQTRIELALQLSAGRIHLARASVGACACTLDSGVTDVLKHVNCVLAAILYNCPCGRAKLTDSERQMLMMDTQGVLTAIADGTLEVCAGETGINYPAYAAPEIAWNDAVAAEIILGAIARGY